MNSSDLMYQICYNYQMFSYKYDKQIAKIGSVLSHLILLSITLSDSDQSINQIRINLTYNLFSSSPSATISPSHISIIVTQLFLVFCDSEKQTENASQVAVRRARHQTCSIWRILPQEILVKGSLVKGSRSSGRL